MINRLSSLARRSAGITALLTCSTLTACAIDAEPGDDPAIAGPVVAQLARSRDTLAAQGLPLQIVGYAAAAPLDSDAAVRLAGARLLDDRALVPQYDGQHAASLSLTSLHDRTRAFLAGDDPQDVVANLQSQVLPRLHVGQKALDVTWDNQGRQFQTTLVYDDDSGVVYDHLLSNLAVTHDNTPSQATASDRDASARPDGAHPDAIAPLVNQSSTHRFVDLTITWLWGATRGQIQLDHYVISCDNWVSFCDDGGQANAWMSLGTAGGDTERNALVYPRISKLAWAYGWATPTASFNISFNADNLTFSASTSGVGSAGKGAGIDAMF